MRAIQREISAISILTILRSGLLILISIQLSLGYMVQYLASSPADSIELAQEKDIETEEKEGKEETEKDELMIKLFCYSFIVEHRRHTFQSGNFNCNQTHRKIPTPPPDIYAFDV